MLRSHFFWVGPSKESSRKCTDLLLPSLQRKQHQSHRGQLGRGKESGRVLPRENGSKFMLASVEHRALPDNQGATSTTEGSHQAQSIKSKGKKGLKEIVGQIPVQGDAIFWLGTCCVADSSDRALVEAMGKGCDFSILSHIKKGNLTCSTKTVPMGQSPQRKTTCITECISWLESRKAPRECRLCFKSQPLLQYSLWVFHWPPLHVMVEVLHVLQPLPKDCSGVISVVVSGHPGK